MNIYCATLRSILETDFESSRRRELNCAFKVAEATDNVCEGKAILEMLVHCMHSPLRNSLASFRNPQLFDNIRDRSYFITAACL